MQTVTIIGTVLKDGPLRVSDVTGFAVVIWSTAIDMK